MTEIHQRVAEDYAAFDVDVTTEEPATITSKVCRVLITEKQQVGNNNGNMPNSGGAGIAWVDVYDTPNFIADFAPALGMCRPYMPLRNALGSHCCSLNSIPKLQRAPCHVRHDPCNVLWCYFTTLPCSAAVASHEAGHNFGLGYVQHA